MDNDQKKNSGYNAFSSVDGEIFDTELRHLIVVCEGVLEVVGKGAIYVLKSGDVMLMPRGSGISLSESKGGYLGCHAYMSETAFERLCGAYPAIS